MACTSVRVIFEIGHEASTRAKQTADGFTHDWELFVRGVDNAEIHHFVEKVVFYLHQTFQNPKRVIKEPPFVVHESGYAGFALYVDIYFKSKIEPTKVRFKYQLTLPDSGPHISNKVREEYVFNNPPEDFRRKLIKGGGFGVGEESTSSSHAAINSSQSDVDHKNSLKNKSSSLDLPSAKKLKKEYTPKNEEKLNANDPFSIFGQPINPSKIPLVPKSNSKLISEKVSQSDKQIHSSKPPKHNILSHKDKDKDRDKEKDRDKDKEKDREKEKHKTKDRDKEKEKSAIKKSKDESVKKDKSREDKMKTSKSSKEETKKNAVYHDDKPSKEKPPSVGSIAAAAAPSLAVEKNEKEAKAEKKDKEKKHKEEKKQKSKEKHNRTSSEKKENFDAAKENYSGGGGDRAPILEKHQLTHSAPPSATTKDEAYNASFVKEEKKAARKGDAAKEERLEAKAKEKSTAAAIDTKSLYATNGSLLNASAPIAHAAATNSVDAGTKKDEKHKHHKHKKDKSKKDGKRDKEEKKEKQKEAKGKCTPPVASAALAQLLPVSMPEPTTITPKHEPATKHSTKKPLDQLFSSEKSDSDSSNADDELHVAAVPPALPPVKVEPATEAPATFVKEEPVADVLHESGGHKMAVDEPVGRDVAEPDSAPKKKKSKKSAEEKEAKKRKRKSKDKGGLENLVVSKVGKYEGGQAAAAADQVKTTNSLPETQQRQPDSRPESRQASLSPVGGGEPKFTDEYITKLKELQRKIMTLEDNSGLQRIVQVVAETGQYEITTQTFDFDLCSLDESIVQRLSDFFRP